ncbi:hypothetical protein [Paenisporosarcina cavernae]|uniref:Aspartyl/asparaginyl-tRNA synthetase n=1 Tax=Paenisporosarcina cavernae TaxID=2320858 RepID=A0A385YY49_9BACL|nr:hypothetical protein [Paenisporosarcina cavernae]AYC30382.1 hypothetical protein D3873_11260 [Paenisporosarcina cavernae]
MKHIANKRILIVLLAMGILSVISFVFLIKGDLVVAVLGFTLLFALTNGYRAISLKEKGFSKESKWMWGMSSFFVLLFLVLLLIIL